MNDLIEALTIFAKYGNPSNPTCFIHDMLLVMAPENLSDEDSDRLKNLSFFYSAEYDCWASYRFGSA